MTKHRRSQKGGLPSWVPFFGSSEQEDPNAPSLWSRMSNLGSSTAETIDNKLANAGTTLSNAAKSTFLAVGEGFKKTDPFSLNSTTTTTVPVNSSSTTFPQYNSTYQTNRTSGGRRRKRARSMKGGKNGLGLTYYAAPVEGLSVAQPTTWKFYENGTNQCSIKGGSRKRRNRRSRKSRRTRRHKRR